MKVKYVFLDFDGTISDSKKIAFESFLKTFDELGIVYDKREVKELMGVKIVKIMKGLGIDSGHEKNIRKKFYGYFVDAAKKGKIKPCVSFIPLIELSKEIPLIVVSNSETRFLSASIKTLGLKGVFGKVYGSDKFSFKDELLKKLFKEYDLKPDEAIYVGDNFSDVRYAKSAKCISVAMSNKCSWSSLSRIKKENPDFIVKDFHGLRKLVHSLNKDNFK